MHSLRNKRREFQNETKKYKCRSISCMISQEIKPT